MSLLPRLYGRCIPCLGPQAQCPACHESLARRLTETPGDAWSRGPSWSPDDIWIAFVSSQAGSLGSDYGEVFIIPALGGDPIQITFTGGTVYDWRVDWGK